MGTVDTGANAHRNANLVRGPFGMMTFLRTDEERGFLTLRKDTDLSTLAPKDMSEQDFLPPRKKFGYGAMGLC